MPTPKRVVLSAVALVIALAGAACGGEAPVPETPAQETPEGGRLIVYSGRNENLVRPLIEQFAEKSGIEVEARYASTTELTATLLEEGENSPADVFFSQDGGALAALANAGLLADLPKGAADAVPAGFRDDTWTGVTGRVRTIVYNTTELSESDVPDSILDVAEPKWKGRIGIAPTNSSFISHVSALRAELGDDKVRGFLAGLKANEAKIYDDNEPLVLAVANGEVDLGLVNHYYALNEKKERPDAPIANTFPDEGAFVNIAGVGTLKTAKNSEQAAEFVAFLLSAEGQEYFRTETNEYPLVEGVAGPEGLPPLGELKTTNVAFAELGKDLETSATLIKEAGLT